jgi:hypothetical protein
MDPFELVLMIVVGLVLVVYILYTSFVKRCIPKIGFTARQMYIPLVSSLFILSAFLFRYYYVQKKVSETEEGKTNQQVVKYSSMSILIVLSFILTSWMMIFLGKFMFANHNFRRINTVGIMDGLRGIPLIFTDCGPLRRASMNIDTYTVPAKI